MVDLNIWQVAHAIVSYQLMLAVDHFEVSLDELLPLLSHLVSLACKLGSLTSIWDAPDHLTLRALDLLILEVIVLEEA